MKIAMRIRAKAQAVFEVHHRQGRRKYAPFPNASLDILVMSKVVRILSSTARDRSEMRLGDGWDSSLPCQ